MNIMSNRKINNYTASFEKDGEKFDVKVIDRPVLTIEEKEEINHLGNKTWTPGESTWENINIILSPSTEKLCLPTLITHKKFDLHLTILNLENVFETWILEDACVESVKVIDDAYNLEIKYSSVQYNSVQYPSKEE